MNYFKLCNIKSFKETSKIDLKKLTIFVGKNSSGKSSLIRFPAVLSQTFLEEVYTPLLFFGKLIDYGNFDDVVFDNNGDSITFSLGFKLKDLRRYLLQSTYFPISRFSRQELIQLVKNYDEISIEVSVFKMKTKRIVVKCFKLFIEDKLFYEINRDTRNSYNVSVFSNFKVDQEEDIKQFIIINPKIIFNRFIPDIILDQDFLIKDLERFIKIKELENINPGIIEWLSDTDEIPTQKLIEKELGISLNSQELRFVLYAEELFTSTSLLVVFLRAISKNINSFANQISYIGPFRKDPERTYRDSESTYKDVGKNGENSSMLLRQAKKSKSPLLNQVSKWFEDSMGYKIDIKEIKSSNLFKVIVCTPGNSKGHNLIDVGYGVAQVLPIVTQIYLDSMIDQSNNRVFRYLRNKTYVIEQPELHLHPAAQAKLADLFVEKITSDTDCQILLETHSEHFLRRLQVLIADPSIKIVPEDIAIYYVDKGINGSTIQQMNLNKKGQFINKWPSGFFDKSYELSKQLLSFSKGVEQ